MKRGCGRRGGQMTKEYRSSLGGRIPAPYVGGRRRRRGGAIDWSSIGSKLQNAASKAVEYGTKAYDFYDKNKEKIHTGVNLAKAGYNVARDKIKALKAKRAAAKAAKAAAANPASVVKQNNDGTPKLVKPKKAVAGGNYRGRIYKSRKAGSVSSNKAMNKIMGGYMRGPIP